MKSKFRKTVTAVEIVTLIDRFETEAKRLNTLDSRAASGQAIGLENVAGDLWKLIRKDSRYNKLRDRARREEARRGPQPQS